MGPLGTEQGVGQGLHCVHKKKVRGEIGRGRAGAGPQS